MSAAPVGETYSGPVLFEGVAGAQLLAEVLAPQLTLPRRPISEPGRPAPVLASEFEGRIGSRVLPEFLDVVDDPTQKAWKGSALLGQYRSRLRGRCPYSSDLDRERQVENIPAHPSAGQGIRSL